MVINDTESSNHLFSVFLGSNQLKKLKNFFKKKIIAQHEKAFRNKIPERNFKMRKILNTAIIYFVLVDFDNYEIDKVTFFKKCEEGVLIFKSTIYLCTYNLSILKIMVIAKVISLYQKNFIARNFIGFHISKTLQ